MNANVGAFLHRRATAHADRPAIFVPGEQDRHWTYGALNREASKVASHLAALGLEHGDRVAICTANGLEFVAAWFGAVYAGCTTLPIPAQSTLPEIAFRLAHADCRAVLADDAHLELATESVRTAGSDTRVTRVGEALETGEASWTPVSRNPDALAMILYTSGTTAAAKGVCITHGSLRTHTTALVEHTLALDEEDRILGALPLTHSYGIRTTLLVPFCAGASTVFVPRFSPSQTLELCAAHGVTWLPAVPTMFVAWAENGVAIRTPALRWAMSAGAPLLEDVRRRAEEKLGVTIRQGYGLTEATFSTINSPPDELVAGSVGKPVRGVTIRIADESDQPLPEGERGEVLIQGQNVMSGYLDDPAATAMVMRGGWLHTGDIGMVDALGRLTVVDRSKDLILRGGHSVYPFEVESALASHQNVADVAVVGIPDAYYGEEIVAVVVTRSDLTPGELDRWARELLAPYKVPRAYAIVAALPQSSSGKTLKRTLRKGLERGEIVAISVRPGG